jgi:hypothetical protein
VYSWTGDGRFLIDGAKLRAEFVVPRAAERSFFYGVNFELGLTPDIGSGPAPPARSGRLSAGALARRSDRQSDPRYFIPRSGFARLRTGIAGCYNFFETWAAALEHYADCGRLKNLEPLGRQQQLLFAVVDYKSAPLSVEFGIGHGFTAAPTLWFSS